MNLPSFLYETNKPLEKYFFKFNNKDTETMSMYVGLVFVLFTLNRYSPIRQVKTSLKKKSLITQWVDTLLASTVRTNIRTVNVVEFGQVFFNIKIISRSK